MIGGTFNEGGRNIFNILKVLKPWRTPRIISVNWHDSHGSFGELKVSLSKGEGETLLPKVLWHIVRKFSEMTRISVF